MPFVKLDCAILNSTLWFERDQREVFITALLMAEPIEIPEPAKEIKIRSLELTGWEAPPGWYGFVRAASSGIIRRACVDTEPGMDALEKLALPEAASRSQEFEGRRMIRIDGGFLILNYMRYRDKDFTAADRMRRLRARRKENGFGVTSQGDDVTLRVVTHSREQSTESRVQRQDTETTGADAPVSASGGGNGGTENPKPAAKGKPRTKTVQFTPPSMEELKEFAEKRNLTIDPEDFFFNYKKTGWKVSGRPMVDWKAAMLQWQKRKDKGEFA